MITQVPSVLGAAGTRRPKSTKQVLFVTRDKEELGDVDQALRELSCSGHFLKSLSAALDLDLERYFAVVLDASIVSQGLTDILNQLVSRAPRASLFVACDTSSRNAIVDTLATRAVEWVAKPIDGKELLRRIHRLERQRRIRVELEDSLHFIQRVADATPEMLYLFDVQDHGAVYVNRQVCSVLGCTPEGISSDGFMFFKSVAHHDDSDRIANFLAMKLAAARDGDVVQAEYRIRDRNGRWRWIRTRETVFHRDENGLPKEILGTAQDITDPKELEQTKALLAAARPPTAAVLV